MKIANYFELLVKKSKLPKLSAKWIISDVFRILKDKKIDIDEFPISTTNLSILLVELNNQNITKIYN